MEDASGSEPWIRQAENKSGIFNECECFLAERSDTHERFRPYGWCELFPIPMNSQPVEKFQRTLKFNPDERGSRAL